jgi:membrane protease YdiL (CAAX protease family)
LHRAVNTDSCKAAKTSATPNGQGKPRILWGFVALALMYFVAEHLALSLSSLPFLQIPGTHWNWSGKAISIVFSGLLLVCSPWLRQNVGLRWRQAPGSLHWSLIIFFSFLAAGTVGGFIDQPLPFSLDTLFYQATMPSIEEELAYRGIMLALLERAFRQSPMSCRWRFGWAALITSLLFWHGVTIEHGYLIVPFSRVDTVVTGAAFALVRTRSGSLLWSMLCHSAINVASAAVAMMR